MELWPEASKSYWKNEDFFKSGEWIRGYVHENYDFGLHAHEFYELNLVLKGSGVHRMGTKQYAISEGDVFVIPPNIRHSYSSTGHPDVYHLLIHRDFFARYAVELGVLPGYTMLFSVEPQLRMRDSGNTAPLCFLHLDERHFQKLMPVLQLIVDLTYDKRPEKVVMENALALYTVIFLCRNYREQYLQVYSESPDRFSVMAACMEEIELRFAEKIRVEELAHRNGMSRSTFLREFRSLTGQTPAEYLLNRRLAQAKMLLRSNKKIAEIAQDCGFYDSAHFIRFFERETGQTPSEFRRHV